MAQILITKPGALNYRDRVTLRKSGVVCVEADEPESVKLIDTDTGSIGASGMMLAAMRAIASDERMGNVAHRFPAMLLEIMEAERALATPHKEPKL